MLQSMHPWKRQPYPQVIVYCTLLILSPLSFLPHALSDGFQLHVEQLTRGDQHHFFGYIGQSRTIPWNLSERYILGLRIQTIDRMPKANEAATIVIIDTLKNNDISPLDKTHAWNPQQGTMFYWNPNAPETQFFFNDRNLKTGEVFTVLYDIQTRERVREYHYQATPVGNGGVAFNGKSFLGINYGRLSRLRPVTGYPGSMDWSANSDTPDHDGIFLVDISTKNIRLLVSYHQLAEKLRASNIPFEKTGLFINHTLWNRESDRIYFFVRGGWSGQKGKRINVPCSMHADGTHLTLHSLHIGGHPEWAEDNLIIGRHGKKQVVYNVDQKRIVETWGTSDIFPDPEGDIALSPNGEWFVNGFKEGSHNHYVVYRRKDGTHVRSDGLDKGTYGGDIRIDPSPRWNRASDAILVPGIAKNHTRQMFIIHINLRED